MKKQSKKNKIYFGQDPKETKPKQRTIKQDTFSHQVAPLKAECTFSRDGIYQIFQKTPHPLRLDDILRRLDISRRSKKEVLYLLQELVEEGKIIRQRGASYALCTNVSNRIGRLSIQRSGAGFVTPQFQNNINLENKIHNEKDIYIPKHALADAWNGDLVEVLLLTAPKPNFSAVSNNRSINQGSTKQASAKQASAKQEGRIVKIWERAHTQISLCIESEAKKHHYSHLKNTKNKIEYAFIARPTDSRFSFRVLLPLPSHEEFDMWRDEEKRQNGQLEESHTNSTTKLNHKSNKYFLHEGDLVIASLVENHEANTTCIPKPISHDLYLGKVIKSLGCADKVSVQEQVTKHNHNIPTQFPDDVLLEAKEIAIKQGFFYTQEDEEDFKVPLLHKDAKNREAKHNKDIIIPLEKEDVDLRDLDLVTIDGADSKDFDDAIFVEKQDTHYRLLVAIADVSSYVLPFSKIDLEAKKRANSYYFPSSVEPMIPPLLSNGLCSLRPDEDHKIMFADMLFDTNGNCLKSSFGQGLMRSKARLTYEAVQSFYDTHQSKNTENKASDDYYKLNTNEETSLLSNNIILSKKLENMLLDAKKLAQILIKKRQEQGALHLEIPEPKCITKNNEIISLATRPHLFAHDLIEAFMVHANEAVASFLYKKNAPCLYRIHPAPLLERIESLNTALQATASAKFLPSLNPQKLGIHAWLANLLENEHNNEKNNEESNEENNEKTSYLTHQLILRSMMQARYSPYLEEHFGLASSCYCHFTSPIRRYSDLMVHRSLKKSLGISSQNDKDIQKILAEEALLSIADTCNEQERIAQNAEREIFRRLACILLESEVNKEFEAVISGVSPFGLFAQMNVNMAEGMIRMEKLTSDYFIYEEETQSLFGQRTKITYRLGDTIQVLLQSVDLSRLEINLVLAKDTKNNSATSFSSQKTQQSKSFLNTNKHSTHSRQKKSSKNDIPSFKKTNKKKISNNTDNTNPQKDENSQNKVRYPKKPKQDKSTKHKKKDHKKKYQDDFYRD